MTLYLIKECTENHDCIVAIFDNSQSARAYLRKEYGSEVTEIAYIEKVPVIEGIHLLWENDEEVEQLTPEEEAEL